jgi:hypothetical protein
VPTAPAPPPGTQPEPPQPPAPRNPDGTFAPAPAQPAPVQPVAPVQPQPPADTTDWRAEAARLRAEADTAKAAAEQARTDAEAEVARWKGYARKHEDHLKGKNEQFRTQDEILRQVAEKLGIDYDDRPDPEVLASSLAEKTRIARDLTVERAIYLGAAREGADAVALLDSREFLAKAAAIDPESAGFPDLVRDLVRDAAKEDRYKLPAAKTLTPQDTVQPAQLQPAAQFQQPPAQQAAPVQPQPQPPAPASGADFSGAPAGDGLWDQQTYDYWATGPGKAIDRNGKIMSDAIAQGKLVRLGVGPSRRPSSRR